jgi:hypothetical protein
MSSSSQIYFGAESHCLDIFILRYRWFGAVWKCKGNYQIVLGFWFGDNQQEIVKQARDARWTSFIDSKDSEAIRSVYKHVRYVQREHDWDKRSRLALHTAFTRPWKDVSPGWYVIRSHSHFPFYIAAVRKKKIFIWLEHVSVCEAEGDVDCFLERVNQVHGIELHVLSPDIVKSGYNDPM